MLHVYLSPRTRERHKQWEATLEQMGNERREALLAEKEKELERKETWIAEKEREVSEKEREAFAALEKERRAKEAAALPRSEAALEAKALEAKALEAKEAALRDEAATNETPDSALDSLLRVPGERGGQGVPESTEAGPEGVSSGFVDWLTEKILGSSTSSDQAADDDSEVRGCKGLDCGC